MQDRRSLDCPEIIFTELGEVLGVQVLDRDHVVDGIYRGIVHNVSDTLLFGELEEFLPGRRIGEFFSGDGEEELFLQIQDTQRFDEDCLDGGGNVGLRPGDGAGLDGAVNQIILGKFALKEGDPMVVSFNFRRENEVIVST